MKNDIILWLVSVILLTVQPLRGEVYPLRTPDLQLLHEEVMVMPEGASPLSPSAMMDHGGFVPLSSLSDSLQGQQYYWLKFTLSNELRNKRNREWILHFSLSVSWAEVYLMEADTVAHTYLTGFFVPIEQRDYAPTLKANLVKFDLPAGAQGTLLVRAKSDRISIPPDLKVKVQSAELFFLQLQEKKQVGALFLGFCLMMLIYTLVLRIYSGDRTYTHYAIYLVSISIYVAYVNGDVHDLVIPAWIPDHPEYIYLVKLTVYAALIGYMSFFRSFLDLQQLLPFWDRFFRILSWLAIPTLFLDMYLMVSTNFSYLIADRITLSYAFFFVGASFLFTIYLYRTHDRKGYFVIAGLIFMGLGIFFTAIDRLQTVEYSVLSFEIGATFELIVFSIGLAYRQAVIRREKQRAQFELEKSQLIQQQEHAEMERQKELNQLKSELYTNITHELRTPLTVIKGMSEQIKGNEREKELIDRNIESLMRLVNQVMDLAQLEAGRMKLQPKQADIIRFLHYLSESFDSNAQSRGILLNFHAEPDQLLMDFDHEKVQQLIYNLLSNALKFTPKGGTIEFSTRVIETSGKKSLLLEIADSGRGIPADELPFIFDRFFQSQLYYHQQYGGSGIGLALTKQLVQLMGGRIEVASTLKEGTTFWVYLPVKQEAEIQEPAQPENHSSEVSAATITSNLTSRQKELPQILLVEDNQDVIAYLEICLEKHFQITKAVNGTQGLELAFAEIPDLIITDVMMPEMNGFDLCDQLKRDIQTSHIPIIMLTAKTDREGRLTSLEKGADAYLTKPFDKKELLLRINQLLDQRKNLQQYFLRTELLDMVRNQQPESEEATFITNLQQVVMEQIDNAGLSVHDLASSVNLGHSQLYRKLKALTGLTPLQFIKRIRLERASQLLAKGEIAVSQVAYAVGFNDPNYFSRSFQQHFGYPPREHYEQVSNEEPGTPFTSGESD